MFTCQPTRLQCVHLSANQRVTGGKEVREDSIGTVEKSLCHCGFVSYCACAGAGDSSVVRAPDS